MIRAYFQSSKFTTTQPSASSPRPSCIVHKELVLGLPGNSPDGAEGQEYAEARGAGGSAGEVAAPGWEHR